MRRARLGALAVVALAGIALAGCGTVTPATAMSNWTSQSAYFANARTVLSDARHSATALRDTAAPQTELTTVCGVLNVDVLGLGSALPTPDGQVTTLINRAVTDFGHAVDVCLSGTGAATRATALNGLNEGAAALDEATARIESITK